jgi:hypothetical protein
MIADAVSDHLTSRPSSACRPVRHDRKVHDLLALDPGRRDWDFFAHGPPCRSGDRATVGANLGESFGVERYR